MSKKKKRSHDYSANMLLNAQTTFVVAEAYRTLRTNLLFALTAVNEAEIKNVVAISSSLPSEGKSVTSANLAIAMAQMDSKILLIDADMRKPVQNKLFAASNARGLSTVLVGETSFEEAVKREIRPNLDLLTSGKIPPNPSELLGSHVMHELLERLSKSYDYIILDTPPISVVSDALTFASHTAGILLGVCPYICKHDHLKKALESIKLANINILGAYLSNTAQQSLGLPYGNKYYSFRKKYGRYGRSYGYGNYGYGYGYGYGGYGYGYGGYGYGYGYGSKSKQESKKNIDAAEKPETDAGQSINNVEK